MPPVPHGDARRTMNKIATGLLAVTALLLVGFGVERILFWLSRPLGPQFGAGEVLGIAVGFVIVGLGAGVGLAARSVWHDQRRGWVLTALCAAALIFMAYVALSTPGPAPIPVPLSVGAALIGLVLAGLAVVHAAGRLAR
jgi:hypothetical protein